MDFYDFVASYFHYILRSLITSLFVVHVGYFSKLRKLMLMLLNVTAVTSPQDPQPWVPWKMTDWSSLKTRCSALCKLTEVENWWAINVALRRLLCVKRASLIDKLLTWMDWVTWCKKLKKLLTKPYYSMTRINLWPRLYETHLTALHRMT